MNEKIDIILIRYFSGEATEKELQYLDHWLLQSNENEQYFHQMTQLYQYAGQSEKLPVIDTEKAWARFKSFMEENRKDVTTKEAKEIRKVSSTSFYRIAAAIALLVVAGFSLYYFTQTSKTIQVMAVDTQKNFTIYEDAVVTLFPDAEMVYNKKNNHQILLKGKAVFTIQSGESQKLIVQAGETYIEDIGTIFTVDATWPEQSITVSVSEGEVCFYTEKNSGVNVKAGESAVYNVPLKQFSIIEEQSPISETPRATDLVFHNTSLYDAIEIIKARYGVAIVIHSNTVQQMLLNASFNDDESVEYILEIIAATLSAQLSKTNEHYIISF